MKNDRQFGAILANAITRAIQGVLIESSLVTPAKFTFSQTFTAGGRIFEVYVASGHVRPLIKWAKLADN